ncbi:winged helix-turn-helix domain-containing protein [Couchioplanes caeruleus]|uniref:GntR family transcriptional regulator n=2 Tax=Couchioplanes caeruleus TaxID=56438 RepID=A0A1K0G755_9ACTN|nr:winged helix-turn-helix domain-containing protein [Couchioplanes caeruleus]OJF13082.1 GntR family transcriptional regulator [Couchioplanes caeruleus subsp. caeruleus]ROP29533.1 regulatory GntR family protein [Couchioplanes caeruleus]
MGEVTANVENTVRGWISAGEYGPGARLPSERQLAAELSAGRTTVRLVLARLAAEGLIRSEHGRGYFVCEQSR